MNRTSVRRRPQPDGAAQHRTWLDLIEITGPFLSLPVLCATWPTLDPLDELQRKRLRAAHADWLDDPDAGQQAWIRYVLADLLGWDDGLRTIDLDALAVRVSDYDTEIVPSFAVAAPGEQVKPDTARLVGLVCPPGCRPTGRVPGSAWAATPVDRLARLCRHHEIELGLVTDGRWWVLLWAPRGGAASTAVFDAVAWPEAAERDVVRAFTSLLCRARFFGVPVSQQLVSLLRASLDSQEEIPDALGIQVRRAVELLMAAIGRVDLHERERGRPGLTDVTAHDIYRGAVSVLMRVVFLLFAEERGLLPADNELYAETYSLRGLRAALERRAIDGSEEDLEHTATAWHQLQALFQVVYYGIDHPRLSVSCHDGSLFHPDAHPWLLLGIDDRTVLHMLRAVQDIEVGTGRSRERRRLSYATLEVEQIGYAYEGLLSWDGFRADDVTVGLAGKPGMEEEVRLADLESLANQCPDVDDLAAALSERFKRSGIGSPRAIARRLAPTGDTTREEQRKRLLAVTGGDLRLAERLLPFAGILRADLRGLPMVVLPGALFMTESRLRKHTGTHYTPQRLAKEIAEGALEPLVYRVGPLETANREAWEPKSSHEILALKVADIAMGSGPFLVAAANYLADHLIQAWSREGDQRAQAYRIAPDRYGDAGLDPLVIEARRTVIENCLYGVDINPMAVEIAKLSLWLVSSDPALPFTFLDDRLAVGDSLLGITTLEQLEYMHVDPQRGRAIHEASPVDFTMGVRALVREAAEIRQRVRQVPINRDPLAAIDAKQELVRDAARRTRDPRLFADLAIGAALAHAAQGERGLREGSIAAADCARRLLAGSSRTQHEAEERRAKWLAVDHVPGTFERKPLHWPLVFPEVFEQGGFDAIVGNPPFLGGQKLTGASGAAYREYVIHTIGNSARGSADLVAYFVLRAHQLLNDRGQTGLLATGTLAQGDTREVGLDQLVAGGVAIRQAIKSEPWPSKSAALEYCAVWTSRAPVAPTATRRISGMPVRGITTSLDQPSRVTGYPERLAANRGLCFIGSYVLGMGFTIEPNRATEMLDKDPRNRDVLFPYLNGQDLNSRPDCSASRWIINFHDWSEDKARTYPDCYERIRHLVKPERDRNNRKVYRDRWWQYAEKRPAMLAAIAGLERVVVITQVSRTVMPVMVPTGQVFSHVLGVFATDDPAILALLSCAQHYWWTVSRASSMRTDIRYTPSDVFETLPMPELTSEMRHVGELLDQVRRRVMLSRQVGLTTTYNLVNDPDCRADDIVELRAIHQSIDEMTCRAYGWHDLVADGLNHGCHDLGREARYTVGSAVRREMVDRLLELNHLRYAEEVATGRRGKGASSSATIPRQRSLFEAEQSAVTHIG